MPIFEVETTTDGTISLPEHLINPRLMKVPASVFDKVPMNKEIEVKIGGKSYLIQKISPTEVYICNK